MLITDRDIDALAADACPRVVRPVDFVVARLVFGYQSIYVTVGDEHFLIIYWALLGRLGLSEPWVNWVVSLTGPF